MHEFREKNFISKLELIDRNKSNLVLTQFLLLYKLISGKYCIPKSKFFAILPKVKLTNFFERGSPRKFISSHENS